MGRRQRSRRRQSQTRRRRGSAKARKRAACTCAASACGFTEGLPMGAWSRLMAADRARRRRCPIHGAQEAQTTA